MKQIEIIEEIIVHPKDFHADETLGISEMRILFPKLRNIPVRRRRPSMPDLMNPARLVIDCGGRYEPELNNFDHHHDPRLPCASRLLWQWFAPEDTEQRKQLKRAIDFFFFHSVDHHDRGIAFASGNSISTVISAINYLPDGFELALAYTELTLRALIAKQKEMVPIRAMWRSGISFGGTRRLKLLPKKPDDAILENFLEYARATKNAYFLIWPVSEGFLVHALHYEQKIPIDRRQCSFHGKYAIYPKQGMAIEHTLELMAKKIQKDNYFERKERVA